MIYTSYFAFTKNIPIRHLVAISGGAPDGFSGGKYRTLAPKRDWWQQWHDEKLSNEWYIQKYYETVLSKLNPADVLRDLDNKIILCWEKPGTFCHRHLISDWLNKNSDAIVARELTIANRMNFVKQSSAHHISQNSP